MAAPTSRIRIYLLIMNVKTRMLFFVKSRASFILFLKLAVIDRRPQKLLKAF